MPELKQAIVLKLFDFLKNKLNSDQWWKLNCDFSYAGNMYQLEVEARMDNQMLTYRNMHIEHKQVVIDVDEMNQKGMLH